MNADLLARWKRIRGFAFDMDGVLSPAGLLVLEDGTLIRHVNVHDGMAMRVALDERYKICIISGSGEEGMQIRFERIGVEHIYFGVKRKLTPLEEFALYYGIGLHEILYMGDDLNDIEPMRSVGLAAAPADASRDALEAAHYVSPFEGGKGAVRDVIEKTLRIQQRWPGKV